MIHAALISNENMIGRQPPIPWFRGRRAAVQAPAAFSNRDPLTRALALVLGFSYQSLLILEPGACLPFGQKRLAR